MQIQLLIGRDKSTNKLKVSCGHKKIILHELLSVPTDVKPEHCMLTINDNGTVLLNGLDSLVYVDGIEIASKVVNSESQVSLGQNDYVFPLSCIISDITSLKSVWNHYYFGIRRIENRQKIDKIFEVVLYPMVIMIASCFIAYLIAFNWMLFIMSGVLFLSFFLLYRIKTDNSGWDQKDLMSQLEQDYRCPNCGTFIGEKKYEQLLFSNCKKCKTMFFSNKKKVFSSIFSRQ